MTAGAQGSSGGTPPDRERTAYILKHRFEWLNQFTDDELSEISLCADREDLLEGGEYFDISHPERGVIVANTGDRVPEGSCYVWRGSVTEELWRKLLSYGKSREAGR